ncbi:MAG: 2-aminomuconate deaminase [Halobacteriovoraceae bacterium]|nr:2-aminomuconate deaminase [Halobacteriovoraceae bacterium]|tara:strand:+ start:8212 stop:8637 length:426 start_codon:yes stop_codon:yes gene_type:complete
MSERIDSQTAPEPVGAYPHARRAGEFLYLSGVGPRKKNSKQIPGVTLGAEGEILNYDIKEQCISVFENVRTILNDAGAKWTDLIDVTVFLTNMKDDFKIYNEMWKEYFGENPPCRTTLEINCLPTPIAIELKCVAYLGEKS